MIKWNCVVHKGEDDGKNLPPAFQSGTMALLSVGLDRKNNGNLWVISTVRVRGKHKNCWQYGNPPFLWRKKWITQTMLWEMGKKGKFRKWLNGCGEVAKKYKELFMEMFFTTTHGICYGEWIKSKFIKYYGEYFLNRFFSRKRSVIWILSYFQNYLDISWVQR